MRGVPPDCGMLRAVGLLGLSLTTGCVAQSLYGAPPTLAAWIDHDQDGASVCSRGDQCIGDVPAAQRDCNDDDPAVHPGAIETAGDGVDSNCNGEDDR